MNRIRLRIGVQVSGVTLPTSDRATKCRFAWKTSPGVGGSQPKFLDFRSWYAACRAQEQSSLFGESQRGRRKQKRHFGQIHDESYDYPPPMFAVLQRLVT